MFYSLDELLHDSSYKGDKWEIVLNKEHEYTFITHVKSYVYDEEKDDGSLILRSTYDKYDGHITIQFKQIIDIAYIGYVVFTLTDTEDGESYDIWLDADAHNNLSHEDNDKRIMALLKEFNYI